MSVILALIAGSLGTVDIDRYTINGEDRQVTLSPRELSAKICRAGSGSTSG